MARAQGQRLDRVDWDDLSKRPRKTRRTNRAAERRVLSARRFLKEDSTLGEFGAHAIRRHLEAQGLNQCPSVRTIGRILQRHGVLDGRRRVRRSPPVRGWYLPEVAAQRAELDSFDAIDDLAIRPTLQVTVLTGVSLHGGLPAAWPAANVTAAMAVDCLMAHWREVGLPAFVQYDNDTRFQGPHHHRDLIGRVIRFCLSLHVTPVFVPPRETGFQAAVESFNGRWLAKVFARFPHRSLRALADRSARYIEASRAMIAPRIDAAPSRRPFPARWRLNLDARPRGTIIYLRRTTEDGRASLLGRTFLVDRHWCRRLVRAQVELDAHRIRFYALRRRQPTDQPLLNQVPYALPQRASNW